ncbi:MAG TPA: hypothetical protein PLD79_01015 [Halothiobacillus sp.]|nr:hypothetical protein [Halothiobacillus sp.]
MDSVERQSLIQWMDDNLFHFSCKAVNSNAQAGGVRLGVEQALDLPYVSARTLLGEHQFIGLDYLVNAGKDATYFKQVRQALGEIEAVDADRDSASIVRDHYHKVGFSHGEKGLGVVSPRLRQLLIPKGDRDYVAITPLGSPGLCEMVMSISRQRKEYRDSEPENHKTTGFDPVINQFSVGGSNPQNVGGRVRAMSRPLVFSRVPQQNPALRTALSLAYRGFRPRLPRKLVMDYEQWLRAFRDAGQKATLKSGEQESALIHPMLDAIRDQAERAGRLLTEHRDALPENTREDALLQSWLSPDVNNARLRAQWLVSTLSGYRVRITDGEQERLILTPEDARRLTVMIEGIN